MVPCRAIVDECIEKNTGGESQNYLSLMANVGVIRYEDKGDVGNKKPDDLAKCKVVRPGNLVINSMNYGIGSYGLSPYSGVCSPVYIVLNPLKDVVDKRYALRVFEDKQFQTWAQSFGNGILAHRSAIGWDDLKNIKVALPPLFEQRILSRFLDHETTKIDALIHEQERLIELLQEKRQAVISHAVTKGLNPDVPMKDSEVEWLGEVPAHWRVLALRRLVNEHKQGYYTTAGYVDDGIKLLRITDLEADGRLSLSRCPQVPNTPETKNYIMEYGDVVFARTGGAGSFGVFEHSEEAVFASYLIRFRFNRAQVSPGFLRHLLLSDVFQKQVASQIHGGVNQNIHAEDIKNVSVALPSMDEQYRIGLYLDDLESQYKALSEEAWKSVELFKERRSALISAAVTGKIDVRDWQPPADESAYDEDVRQTGMEATV